MDRLQWTALEYEEKDRSPDWFWALGVVVAASSATAIIFGNYFFAILIILSGVLLGFFATKKPDEVSYELNDKGLKIRTYLYPYEKIKSFWVQKSATGGDTGGVELKPILFIKSERMFLPILSIPIHDDWAEKIHAMMSDKDVPEEEMKEHVSEKIMESLGF